MPRSMTGFGLGEGQSAALAVRAEIRSVNGRQLKVSMRVPPFFAGREADVEALVRGRLTRGSVNVTLSCKALRPELLVHVNRDVALAYKTAFDELGLSNERVAMLPGVLDAAPVQANDEDWAAATQALEVALTQLDAARQTEGAALAQAMTGHLEALLADAALVAARAPEVLLEHRARLEVRWQKLLAHSEVSVDPAMLAREVAVLADRCDITEELDRLRAHVARGHELLSQTAEVGRSLDFLTQELHREVNTLSQKSADVDIAHRALAMKLTVEKLKEQAANLE